MYGLRCACPCVLLQRPIRKEVSTICYNPPPYFPKVQYFIGVFFREASWPERCSALLSLSTLCARLQVCVWVLGPKLRPSCLCNKHSSPLICLPSLTTPSTALQSLVASCTCHSMLTGSAAFGDIVFICPLLVSLLPLSAS